VTTLGYARELILTGRLVGAAEALERGLVNGVHDPVLSKAQDVATLVAAKSLPAVAAAKALCNRALQGDHESNLRREEEQLANLFVSDDAREGMAAFLEKREPRFYDPSTRSGTMDAG
jgi:enoyl-CoA hydratase/carnithine racemase